MIHHGIRPARTAASEVDALQADVMRFVAIIGLCLAAIFSLLREAQPSSAEIASVPAHLPETLAPAAASLPSPEPRPESAAQPVPAPKPVPVPVPVPESTPPPAAIPAAVPATTSSQDSIAQPDQPAVGYSLSFASDQALLELLSIGSVSVYAISAGQFWRYQVAGKRFEQSNAPATYHEMDGVTVPIGIRQWMVAAGQDVDGWGVVLSGEITDQLQSVMNSAEGGELIIHRNGLVDTPGRALPGR